MMDDVVTLLRIESMTTYLKVQSSSDGEHINLCFYLHSQLHNKTIILLIIYSNKSYIIHMLYIYIDYLYYSHELYVN